MFLDVFEAGSQSFGFGGFGFVRLGGASAGGVGTHFDGAEEWFSGDRGGEGSERGVDGGGGGRDGKANHVAAG